jgi:hypothetical protein
LLQLLSRARNEILSVGFGFACTVLYVSDPFTCLMYKVQGCVALSRGRMPKLSLKIQNSFCCTDSSRTGNMIPHVFSKPIRFLRHPLIPFRIVKPAVNMARMQHYGKQSLN